MRVYGEIITLELWQKANKLKIEVRSGERKQHLIEETVKPALFEVFLRPSLRAYAEFDIA